ncbi:uncharacterized protein LOC141883654 [Acropora palmata]|uniref:uncharacterized protein LOC141883654 n=1 Tax=Acropora palmata TaxID=6131 RepID=UPI003DA1A1B5
MSGATESPVSKYGRSSEFGAVLDFIQTMISNDTLSQAFKIPHLVMVGKQNMEKTTLINRLIGRYLLPMRRNETANTLQARTTYPIILNLRNGPKTKVEVRCESIPDIGGTVEDPKDDLVEQFLNKVSDRFPKEPGTPISKTPVNVTLHGPSLTTLTLVDLLGAHFANDDQRMNHVTQQLVLEYIKKNTKSIIVIVSEVGDPTGDSAINLVMTQAQDFRTRTISVLTKPDKLRMEDDMGKRVALNQSSFTLEDGRFIVLRAIFSSLMVCFTTRQRWYGLLREGLGRRNDSDKRKRVVRETSSLQRHSAPVWSRTAHGVHDLLIGKQNDR